MNIEKFKPRFRCGRFAPSTTGRVHPGTLIAGLLCWLDARSSGAEVVLRLEDLDRERTKSGYVDAMSRDLEWFGLDWDRCSRQSKNTQRYDVALEALVEEGRVYVCDCSRAQIREVGRRAPDGSYRYPGTCRARSVTSTDWRTVDGALRLRLDSVEIPLRDESGLDLSGDAVKLFGDPILRRREGVYSYHFASVLDDSEVGVDRVVRGRDLAPSTILQVALQRELLLETPCYRHHCLFLERTGDKLSKFHGAVGVDALREKYDSSRLCGLLASFVGLVPAGTVCRPVDLVEIFDWSRIRVDDVELEWGSREGLLLRPG